MRGHSLGLVGFPKQDLARSVPVLRGSSQTLARDRGGRAAQRAGGAAPAPRGRAGRDTGKAERLQTERRRRRYPVPGDDLPPLERPVSTFTWGVVVFEDIEPDPVTDTSVQEFLSPSAGTDGRLCLGPMAAAMAAGGLPRQARPGRGGRRPACKPGVVAGDARRVAGEGPQAAAGGAGPTLPRNASQDIGGCLTGPDTKNPGLVGPDPMPMRLEYVAAGHFCARCARRGYRRRGRCSASLNSRARAAAPWGRLGRSRRRF